MKNRDLYRLEYTPRTIPNYIKKEALNMIALGKGIIK